MDKKYRFNLFLFFQYFSVGILGPYTAIFLAAKNYSSAQIGILLGVMPIVSVVTQPVWGLLSDVTNKRKYLLVIGSLGVALASLGFVLIDSFFLMLLCSILYATMIAPISPISTAIILDYLEEYDHTEKYSLIRLWGSLGFAISSILMGGLFLDRVLDYFGYFLAGIYLILGGISIFLHEPGKSSGGFGFKGLSNVLRNPRFLLILIASVFIGATVGILVSFQSLSLISLDASDWLIGLIISFQALIEIPMLLTVPILNKRLSLRFLILLGAVALPIRWLLYIFIKDPVWIIPTQIINGLSTISFFVAAIAFIDQLISPKWRGTGQALYSTTFTGIGAGLGVYFAGLLIDRFGIAVIWPFNLILGLIGLVLMYFAVRKPGETSEQAKSEK